MKRHLFPLIVLISLGMLVLAAIKPGGETGLQVVEPARSATPIQNTGSLRVDMDYGRMPLYFIANQGQMDGLVAYYVQGKDKTLYFTQEGVTIALNGPRKSGEDLMRVESARQRVETQSVKHDKAQKGGLPNGDPPGRDALERWVVKLDFVGAHPDVKPVGTEKTGAVVSYFKGKPEDWKAGLPTYSKVVYPSLWPGIDLAYYGDVSRLKYEFIVHPGADPGQIRLAYRGATRVSVLADGRLEVTTPLGSFQDDIPVAYQEVNGRRVSVSMAYKLEETGQVKATVDSKKDGSETREFSYGFAVGDYDPGFSLILDPVIFVYCGYIGGSAEDRGLGITVDGLGNAYVTGVAWSSEASFPVTVGPDLTENGNWDAFVAKAKADGTGLVYCGYIGGSYVDRGHKIAVDGSGNAYVAGYTRTNDGTFPATVGPDLTYNGLDYDGFVAKVNAAGTALVYCGYIGGWANDSCNGIAVDGSGNAYVTGSTNSNEASFPVTVGPDLAYNAGDSDGFVAKVNAAGTGFVYCGYIGGSGSDWGNGITVDGSGNAYVTGGTASTETSFPVSAGPDLTYNGGGSVFDPGDAFVAKVKADGTALVYCGYVGGSANEGGSGIAVDGSGNAYVTGWTYSSEASFPATVGPDLTYNGGSDAFVAKVKADGTALVYCGYIGGGAFSGGSGIAVDVWGNAYITGDTSHWDSLPVLIGPDLTSGGNGDGFIAKVKADGTALVYCGYIGGGGIDVGAGIAVDRPGNAYVAGHTGSDQVSFPVSVGPDLTLNGSFDAFVAKVLAFSKVDLLGTWDGQGIFYRNSETGKWIKLYTPADLVAAGDIGGDGIDDLIAVFASPAGVWTRSSSTGKWTKLSSTTARHISSGDMNGDGRDDLLATWDGEGVYYRNSISGAWVKMAQPANLLAAGDLDGDNTDDLITVFPSPAGVWVKSSKTGTWTKLSSTSARDIASGYMNADGREDLLGTWDGTGVYYRNSISGAWVKMAQPADLVTAAEHDLDGTDDVMTSSASGVFVKSSKTGVWTKLADPARDIAAGVMRGGIWGSRAFGSTVMGMPAGDYAESLVSLQEYEDLSEQGPGGWRFAAQQEENLLPHGKVETLAGPGPGDPGFTCMEENNLVPQEGLDKEQPKQRRSRTTEKNRR